MSFIDNVLNFLYENSPTSYKVSARKICELYKTIKYQNPMLSSKEIAFFTLSRRHALVKDGFSDEFISQIIEESEDFEQFILNTVFRELILSFGEEKIGRLSDKTKIDVTRRILEEVYRQGLQNENWY
ncbi:hypothetical protein KKA87_10415 [bacterium]|nr:hypothetical protein [bacterium]MBU1874301.1 hypothetical protein [bacterium]